MELRQQVDGFYGWKNAAILFFLYLISSGIVFYGFTVIFPAMITDMGWGRGEASLAHTFRVLLLGLLSPVAAMIINRYGSKKTIVLGLVTLAIGLALLGTVLNQLWQWIMIWGFIMPIGFAFAGLLPIQTTITFWFDIRRATVIGLVMSGAGIGGFIAQPLFTWLMESTGSWRMGWLAAGAFVLVGLILSAWVKSKPEDIGQYPDGINPNIESKESDSSKQMTARTYRTPVTWTLKEAFRTRTLWFFIAVMVAQLMPLYLVTAHGVLHFTDVGYSKMEAASILSLVILSSGLARFPMGWLADRIEPRWILSAAMCFLFLMLIVIWKAPNHTALMVAGAIFGLGYGTALVMIPTMIGNYFGAESFASINGFIFPIMIAFGAVVPVGAGYIADKLGSYDLAFIILIIILAIGIISAFFSSPPNKTK